MRRFLYSVSLCLLASPGQAACFDEVPFGRTEVEICIGDRCETARLSTSCGNIYYEAENYTAESVIWMFRLKLHDDESDIDDEYLVLHDPLDPNDIPLQIVDGRPIRLVGVGVPLDAETVQQVTCIPKSRPEACSFINFVLENLR